MRQAIHVEEEVAEGLDEDAWMNCMRQRILVAGSDGPKHEEHLIYKVNPLLREGTESRYDPIATSIGPYHHGKEHLLEMETHKRRYVCHLLSRNENIRFEDLVKMIKEREEQVRACYLGKNKLKSNAFVEMMLLDGCFIVELLLKIEHGANGDDLFVGPNWRRGTLYCHDLVLLENQLPFFLLQEIFYFVMPDEAHPSALLKLSLKYLKRIGLTHTLNKDFLPLKSVHHLLHLWHMHLISLPAKQPQAPIPAKQSQVLKFPNLSHLIRIPFERSQDSKILKCNNLAPCLGTCNCCKGMTQEQENSLWMPGVTQLEEAGVKFKASSNNLLDIKFVNGEMMIPAVVVMDYTETQLRNLIAFEQCCLKSSSSMEYNFSSYVIFLNYLINTSKDVEILHKKGILTHGLGNDEEVAQMFNKLNKGICLRFEENYLTDTLNSVNNYSSTKLHKWRASLVRDYFYSPWAILSFIAAIVALSLVVIQTFCSVESSNNSLHQSK